MGASVDVRCPHCKGKSFSLYERLEVLQHYRVEEGEARPMFPLQDFPQLLGFAAKCDCGHEWVPRHPSAIPIWVWVWSRTPTLGRTRARVGARSHRRRP